MQTPHEIMKNADFLRSLGETWLRKFSTELKKVLIFIHHLEILRY
jgi:hypothetical protein